MAGVHATEVLARFQHGSPITTLNLGILGSNGLRNVIGVAIKGYHIKVPGNTNIPPVVFLTTDVVGLFPNQCNRFGPTFECIPITLYPTIVDGNGDLICTFSSELIHVPSKEISYHNSRAVIDVPNKFSMGLGLYSDSSFPAATTAPPQWPCTKVLDVAGDSTIVFEFIISHEGQKQSFPEKFSIGYGHTSNI
jgi:hypothetical protein